MAKIAIVSFEHFLHGDERDRLAVANEVYEAFSTVGWVYLKDTGISQEQVDGVFALAKKFFQLPLAQKSKYSLNDPAVNQGYTADGAEGNGGRDHKEAYEHRRFANALCPSDEDLPAFRQTLDVFYNQCLELALNVLRCLSLAMHLDTDGTYFDSVTTHADPQLRLVHYPEIQRADIEQAGHARIMPHTDFGLCTLLFQDSIGGLEVDPFHTGDFLPAKPIPGTVLINIADLLQRLTNDRVRSTRHRVVSPPMAVGDILPARYSIPFFVHPDPEALIDPITLAPGEEKRYAPVNAGEWRTWNTSKNYQLNGKDAPIAAM